MNKGLLLLVFICAAVADATDKCADIKGYFQVTEATGKAEETEYADFAWMDKSILLFTIEKKNSYDNLVNSQNKYKCYLLTDSFDYVSFVTEVND